MALLVVAGYCWSGVQRLRGNQEIPLLFSVNFIVDLYYHIDYMNILITGATGFIGSALVPALLSGGHRLSVLSRDPARARRVLGEMLRIVATPEALPASPAIDAVINLAGAPIAATRWSKCRKRVLRASRIDLTARVIEKLEVAGHRPQVFISASAVGYYGDQREEPITLASVPQPDFAHHLCRDWEADAARASDALGARVCIVRLGLVLGPGGLVVRLVPLFRCGLGGAIGGGEQWFPWIHLDDVVAMLVAALTCNDCQGPYNLVAPGIVRQREFARTLGALMRRPLLLPVPASCVRLALGEMAVLLLGGQYVVDGGMPGSYFRYLGLYEALADCIAH